MGLRRPPRANRLGWCCGRGLGLQAVGPLIRTLLRLELGACQLLARFLDMPIMIGVPIFMRIGLLDMAIRWHVSGRLHIDWRLWSTGCSHVGLLGTTHEFELLPHQLDLGLDNALDTAGVDRFVPL